MCTPRCIIGIIYQLTNNDPFNEGSIWIMTLRERDRVVYCQSIYWYPVSDRVISLYEVNK